MPKREPLTLDAVVPEAASPVPVPPAPPPLPSPEPEEREEFDNLYIRCPRSLVRKLRRRAFELSETKNRRVSQTDIVVAALKKYLEDEKTNEP